MRRTMSVIVLALLPASWALALTSTTVTFQNGVNGYTGTFEHKISETLANNVDGSTTQAYFMDGYVGGATPSPDESDLIRFDNIFGAGAGLVPTGAFILDAKLQYTTGQSGSANTNGPYGVAGLNQAFDSTTEYFASFPCSACGGLGSRGAWWQDGAADPIGHPYSTRPTGGYGGQITGSTPQANVRPLVQNWSNGQTNFGMAVQSGFTGTTDGWQVQTIGATNVNLRPKLSVTYTTAPIAVNTIQRDLNGYTGDTTAWVRSGPILTASGTNPDPTVDDVTYDGQAGTFIVSPTTTQAPTNLTSFQQFLDGPDGATSPDDIGLFKFSNVFGAGAGQAPAGKPVAKAWLVLTTGDASANARSPGEWAVYAMQRNWDPTTTLYSNIGATPGLQVADGDISTPLSSQIGMTTGSEVWLDVTSYLEGVRNGATDFGLAVASTGTADGWQIHYSGSATADARPRLVVASDMSVVVPPGVLGDYNGNGVVDAADYVLWRKGSPLQNEVATVGSVTPEDYTEWRARFDNTSGSGTSLDGASVPEPATWLLGLAACVASVSIRSRKSLKSSN